MITEYTIIELLRAGAALTAAHSRIPDCTVVVRYEKKHGILDYHLGEELARSVRCGRGVQPCLDAMSTVAAWSRWAEE
jgi:hypothetical protein